ncbi:MAG TPA: hypothetical protein VFT08_10930 [Pyrinomonadaceae bacterium]|nr:hypothetical protein [Pyrinomonadaceae bacterium]
MKPLSPDTTPEAQRKQYEMMRRLSPEQKLSLAFSLTETMRQLVLADLHHRFPQADSEEIRKRFIARVLPREDVIRAYGFDPKVEGF